MCRTKEQKSKIVFTNSGDESLSSLIKRAWRTCTFLNYFREVNE